MFKENVLKLAQKMSSIRVPQYKSEPKPPLLIWTTTPPCSCDVPIIGNLTYYMKLGDRALWQKTLYQQLAFWLGSAVASYTHCRILYPSP